MKKLDRIWFITLLLCVSVTPSGARAEGFSSTTPTVGFTFTHNLALGSRGNDVSALQQFLISGGFLKILTPSGYFGPLTRTALGAWQASVGISPSAGFFGPISRGKINSAATPAPINITPVQGTAETTSAAVVRNKDGSPVRLKIPKLSVDAGFQHTGLTSDGAMEIPDNIVDVGWFTGSARPGEHGTAVVTGHVAQIRGGIMTKPGVFSDLNELRAGDTLYVQNDKGESITFIVRESRNYDPATNAIDVFTSKDNGVHLNLITCEGAWNPDQLSYTQRLVIFTDVAQ
ncbi:MAG: sortase [bacterium]|nr:sortase [bacterium]